MNRMRICANFFWIAMVVSALVFYSDLPVIACPQSSQSSSAQSTSTESTSAQPSSDSQTGNNSLPEAPGPQSAQSTQQSTQTPSGAAGAQGANPKGAPVAQPAGAAVAPAKQRGHRSLLIKLGLLVGGAAAVGTVVALSEKSPTRPPGTAASTRP